MGVKLSLRVKCFLAVLAPVLCAPLAMFAAGRSLSTQGVALLIVGSATGLAASLAAGWLLSGQLSRRIEHLIQSAELVAAGVHIKSLDTSRDELGQLASALVEMSRHVIEQKARMHEVGTRLEAVLRASKDVSILAEDLEGRLTICNPGAERLLGYRQSELVGRKLEDIVHPRESMREHQDAISALRSAKRQAVQDASPDHENIYCRRDGMCLHVQLSITPMKDMQGQTVGLLHVAHDISHRKVLESELRHKNEELKKQAREHASSRNEVSQLAGNLQETAATLKTVTRLLLSVQENVSGESDLELLYQCRGLTESALTAIRQVAELKETTTVEVPSRPGMLPELLRMSTAIQDEPASLKEVDRWYREYGDIPTSAEPRHRRSKILVVDDFDATRTLMKVYLQDLNCDLDFAGDGQAALSKIAVESYGLVLMDIEMPGMDGHETARRVRAWEQAQGRAPLPLIAMTAHSIDPGDCFEKSVWTSSLHKPLTKGQLLSELRRHLKPESVGS